MRSPTMAQAARAGSPVERQHMRQSAALSGRKRMSGEIQITVHDDLSAIERDWRRFEQTADCTVFQTFDWLATWQRHIGDRTGVTPAIVVGRDDAGALQFILPLAVRSGRLARELTWLGSDLCDYNGPLLTPSFSLRIDAVHFLTLWAEICATLQAQPHVRFDLVNLVKMPETVGAQPNPMLALAVTANPSGAYRTPLGDSWDAFYATKRTSSSQKRDRAKRKRLGELGAVRLVNPDGSADRIETIETLMTQKARSFARMGVGNLFGKPGHAAFYRALASDPALRPLVQISRLEIGATPAAVNIGLKFGHSFYHLQASYDDGPTAKFGAGSTHLQELMRQAIERGFHVFDFTIGDEPYKRDWCDSALTLYDHIAAATWRGTLAVMPAMAAQRLKRWIKQTPALWRAVSKTRALLSQLRR